MSVTLLLLSVENPDEQSVSVGELGQECTSLCSCCWFSHSAASFCCCLFWDDEDDGLCAADDEVEPFIVSQLKMLPATSQPTSVEAQATRLSREFWKINAHCHSLKRFRTNAIEIPGLGKSNLAYTAN